MSLPAEFDCADIAVLDWIAAEDRRLNAEQALVNARVALIVAQHDRVVASYALLSAVGRLSARDLGLPIAIYDPSVHYHQIRDAWFGLRTPDGR